MPPIVKTKNAPALRSRREHSLEDLVFRMGGVAGAVRRTLHRAKTPLTMNQLSRRVAFIYPKLRPARDQVEDVIQQLVDRGIVVFNLNARDVRLYQWNHQPKVRVKSQSAKQLVFEVL